MHKIEEDPNNQHQLVQRSSQQRKAKESPCSAAPQLHNWSREIHQQSGSGTAAATRCLEIHLSTCSLCPFAISVLKHSEAKTRIQACVAQLLCAEYRLPCFGGGTHQLLRPTVQRGGSDL